MLLSSAFLGILEVDTVDHAGQSVINFTHPTAGNCPMLNSDQDLNTPSNFHITRSRSLQNPQPGAELSIEQSLVMPIFAEATVLASQLTEAPVAILTTVAGTGYQIGGISGLSQLRAMPNNPNLHLELAGLEYCHDRIITSQSSLSVPDFHHQPQLAQSTLLQVHGLKAYLGVPAITAARDRIGVLAVLDFKPRQFSDRDIELLLLISRLLASEFERKLLSQAQLNHWIGDLQYRATPNFDAATAATYGVGEASCLQSVRDRDQTPYQLDDTAVATRISTLSSSDRVCSETQFELLIHLAHELRTPLTSVLGMASVLQQEIYGPLTTKQKDYLGIIHQSGRKLVAIVDEISQLEGCGSDTSPLVIGQEYHQPQPLTLKLVDLEMLCQLVIQSLDPIAAKKQQKISLDLSVGESFPTQNRIWLDKDKVRQAIYYLCLSLLDASAAESQICLQFTYLADLVQIQLTTNDSAAIIPAGEPLDLELTVPAVDSSVADLSSPASLPVRIRLGLSLSHVLAAAHGGRIELTTNVGLGYLLTLPQLVTPRAADPNRN